MSISSAGCLIIGDEVLNGKILDINSHKFARFCFQRLQVPLKKTIVCGDDKDDIIESLKILTASCDLVITSGGIGSTHDDITYDSLAEAYGLSTHLDSEVVERMHRLRNDYLLQLKKPQKDAFYRMATIPKGDEKTSIDKIFISDDFWVPIVALNRQVYVLPGVPQLFERLLVALEPHLKPRVSSSNFSRRYVKTITKESDFAPFLGELQAEYDQKYGPQVVKLGSYPHLSWKINTVSIIGSQNVDLAQLDDVVSRVVAGVGGGAVEIREEEEERLSTEEPQK